MTPDSTALLRLIASRKQGRVSYALLERDRAMAFAEPLLEAGYVIERRKGFEPGFQITEAGRQFLGGEG